MSDPRYPPTDPPPPGREWVWSDASLSWHLVAESDTSDGPANPTASASPMRPAGLGPFEMPVKRNDPLPADHKGVVAVGETIRRMR